MIVTGKMPAFPNNGAFGHSGGRLPEGGMTMREWLIAQALVGMGTWCPCDNKGYAPRSDAEIWKAKAEWACGQADAILASLSKDHPND